MPDVETPQTRMMGTTVVPPRFMDGFRGLLHEMPNPSDVVEGWGPDVFDRVAMDAHVRSCLTQREGGVLGKDWQIEPFDESPFAVEVAEYVRGVFQRELSLSIDLRHLVKALRYGYSVSEAVWRNEGTWVLESLKSRHHRRFAFRRDGSLVLVSTTPKRVLDMPYKFIVHRHDDEAENPYGTSILEPCYWPWRFKNMGWESWLTVLDRFGVPSLAAFFDGGSDDTRNRELANLLVEQLLNVSSGSAGAFPNVKDVKQIAAGGKGDDFYLLLRATNEEISKAILTVTLTTDADSRGGGYALGNVHSSALDEKVAQADRIALATTMTRGPVLWQTALRFGEAGLAVPPSFVFDEFQTAPWEHVRDGLDRGIPMRLGALRDTYNLPVAEEGDEEAFVAATVGGTIPPGMELADDGRRTFYVFRGKRAAFRS